MFPNLEQSLSYPPLNSSVTVSTTYCSSHRRVEGRALCYWTITYRPIFLNRTRQAEANVGRTD